MEIAQRIDVVKAHPEVYEASREPDIVDVGPGTYLVVAGRGAPRAEAFRNALGALGSICDRLKYVCLADQLDFRVAPLEASWWSDVPEDFSATPPQEWNWEARIRVPDFIDDGLLDEVRAGLEVAGKPGPLSDVRLAMLEDGPCVRVLHLGPYSEEGPVIQALHSFARERGFTLRGHHHEVYLSDPQRTKPESLRTVLLHPVASAAPAPA